MYYNYHATAKRLIAEGHLTNYQFLPLYNGIADCLLLLFDNHKPMPIRNYRIPEYLEIISNIQGLGHEN